MKSKTKALVRGALIAALYCALTLLALVTPFGVLSFGPVQVRIAEGLCILPAFTPVAIPGLFVGCLISNIVGAAFGYGGGLLDIVFGSLATLLSAYLAWALRRWQWLVPLPAVLINAVIVGIVLYVSVNAPLWLTVLSVGAGQALACYGLGMPLMALLRRHRGLLE
jgi:uncharacterized membrane protein